MRIAELFAAPAAVADHPAVRAAARMAAEELTPRAARADDPAAGVQPTQLRALAGAGLLSVREPVELGGFAADLRTQLEVALLPATERPGLRAGGPLPLSVMRGTRTVALDLTGVEVADDEVLLTVDGAVWREHDRCASANAKPGALGLLRRVLTELQSLARERGDEAALETARRLAEPAARMRERAYELVGTVPPRELVEERAALRGALAELAVRAAHALVAVRAGRAMLVSSPEQRWAREAAFHLIQAQTPAVRAAQLAAFGR